ncbi:MAG: hypothetical protein HC880_00800 [Bacteroidia bacterium]|nr:hypothetical protein [Bacteroidia bacterium]
MKNKPYIKIAGIPKIPIEYPTSQGTAIITTHYTHTAQGREVYRCQIAGKDTLIAADTRPDLVDMVAANKADYEARFEGRYPGIYDLVSAINAESAQYEAVHRMMDDEHNDGVNPPRNNHALTVLDQAQKKYPIAGAYLSILRYADADPASDIGFNRRCWGNDALAAIEAGADVIAQLDIIRAKEAMYVSPIN